MRPHRLQGMVLALGALVAGVIAVTAYHSTHWLGTTFPGFLVMRNGVVASVALPGWDETISALFQHEVRAVNGTPVHSAAALYAQIRQVPVGTAITYQVRGPDGVDVVRTVPTRRFAARDYVALFGAFLVTGVAFVLTGLLVFAWRPHHPASHGLLSVGLIGGLFAITGADLYGPHWFFRLHVLTEALVPASLLHLALVFPTHRLRGARVALLLGVYGACGLLALAYEVLLYRPMAYSHVHLWATAAQGAGGLVLVATAAYDLLATTSAVIRRRTLAAALGTVAGFLIPSVLMAASGLGHGQVPVNGAAVTGCLFPLALGYAIVRGDFFKLDVFLQQAALACLVFCSTTCFAVVSGLVALKSRLL